MNFSDLPSQASPATQGQFQRGRFGQVELPLSSLGFGAAPIGNLYSAVTDEQAYDAVAAALGAGISYLDTAPHYGFGLSEARLGQFLSLANASSVNASPVNASPVISTKVGRILMPCEPGGGVRHGFAEAPALEPQFDYSYDGVMRSFESSLARLKRERVDILFAHDLGRATHGDRHQFYFKQFMDGGYLAMQQLKADGRVSALGLGANEWQVCEEAMAQGDFDGFLLAGRYSLLEQGALASFFPRCAARGASVILGGPFNSGILASGVKGAGPVYYNYAPAPAEIIERVAQLEMVCEEFAVSLPAAALQFPLAHVQVVSVLAGFANRQQVQQAACWMEEIIPAEFWQRLQDLGLLHPDAPLPEA